MSDGSRINDEETPKALETDQDNVIEVYKEQTGGMADEKQTNEKASTTLMAISHCHKPVLWSKWPLASSLLQAIKTCRQACPPGYLMHFS